MALTAEDIAGNPLTLPLIKQQSATLHQAYQADPRMSSVFATQQRWLLAHAALALHFRAVSSDAPPFTVMQFLDKVALHGIASRNTAHAFIQEMVNYGYAEPIVDPRDRRAKPMTISSGVLGALWGWVLAHLATLDHLDDGRRAETFLAAEGAIAPIEIAIAEGLLTNPAIRQPQDTFSLFTWLNNGGVIMDRLIMGVGELGDDGTRYPTAIGSASEIAGWLRLSRTHFARKMREAEAMGSLGWMGRQAASTMWVSAGFVREMIVAQATKLAVIDAAYERCLGR